ncbi:MAG TPA: hypothetical protein VFW92_04205 [Candidatus Limnocylindrales bacterium]|nr:hypothetical protein [Candidatus Limnocylindrales bacterium]
MAATVLLGSAIVLLSGGRLTAVRPTASASARPSSSSAPSTSSPTAGNWVAQLPGYADDEGLLGTDGRFFVANAFGIAALGTDGRPLDGWPIDLPIPWPIDQLGLRPNGDLLVAGGSRLADVSPQGRVRSGWPVAIGSPLDGPFVAPDGTVYVITGPVAGASAIIGLSADGLARSGWPQSISGTVVDLRFEPDGTIVLETAGGSQTGLDTLTLFAPDGARITGGPVSGWTSFTTSRQNDLVVWRYETSQTASGVRVRQTTVARLARDGTIEAGWPAVFPGPASDPLVAPDGTIYLVLGDGAAGHPGAVTALDRGGRVLSGWPVGVAAGAMPLPLSDAPSEPAVAAPPALRPGGGVIVAAANRSSELVDALDASGKRVAGWPYVLPPGQTIGGLSTGVPASTPARPLVTPDGSVFLLLDATGRDLVATLDAQGHLLSGSPIGLPASFQPHGWGTLASGGVEIQGVTDAADGRTALSVYRIVRGGTILPSVTASPASGATR